MKTALENPPKAAVDRMLTDGEELPFCGGVTVIGTPGHTPGHFALVAGDALVVTDGRLDKMSPHLTFDPDEAARSLRKLTRYDVETAICYHGGLYQGDVNKRLAVLAP
ncbi:MAG: hypothetical protein M0Z41_12125 [Peptococcaceae bacterium]|jgi:glyoxylase-like metal-dependent hydrolase (beta-lactamase superfamily II)|nr:hypothetical protein [Peptococcaceae bacterium]